MQRFLIAGTHSGCGKTTVTCAILAALKHRGIRAASFKCGPDYIDPMFHTTVLDTPAHNLDSFFCSPERLRYLFDRYSKDAAVSVLEGVMGYYDGGDGSAKAIAGITATPAVIVIDCKGMSDSIGAVMQGFLRYRMPSRIAGFLFNRLPLSLVPLARHLCKELGTQYFGCMPVHSETFDSRHLGLVTAEELPGLREKMQRLGELAEKHILLNDLLKLPCDPLPPFTPLTIRPLFEGDARPLIAVAKDAAFNFYYAENLDLLQALGCRLAYFSPLTSRSLPEADGLLLGGGYPELYAGILAANNGLLAAIRRRIKEGMPVIAECGGFLYLHRLLMDTEGRNYQMATVFSGEGRKTDKLQRFGYVTLHAPKENLLFAKDGKLRAHEFHYWESTTPGSSLTAVKRDGRTYTCCFATPTMYAGFPHLYFWADPDAARRFVLKCGEKR
ncbi:MAG: cobyrinate a,c-diamide synthase [Oscillospiraceae bacterium]|nr:cobyrinate a,c-diamide synthase [Oscillospiraceae bacterium]